MDYLRIYDCLIERCKDRVVLGYVEKHHIIPKCMGGRDNKTNIVKLTAREHFIAHMLLMRIYSYNRRLAIAVSIMCAGSERRLTNRFYGKAREYHAQAMSEIQRGCGNSQFGTKWIHNDLLKSELKIDKNHDVPIGYLLGRFKKEKPIPKSQIRKSENIKKYSKYFEIYSKYGFDKFVIIVGYKFSQENLVQGFKRYIKDFSPQNGKKRG